MARNVGLWGLKRFEANVFSRFRWGIAVPFERMKTVKSLPMPQISFAVRRDSSTALIRSGAFSISVI